MKFLEIEAWQKENEIIHGFGTKDHPGKKIARMDWRGDSVVHQGHRLPLLSLRQVHGDGMTIFQGGEQEAANLWEKEGDALITCIPGVAIGVFTADCLPILLFDPGRRVIGAVHAGWRGTAQALVKKVVERMIGVFDCRVEEIQAGVGPCIGPCCYEVDEWVETAFRQNAIPWERVASPRRPGKWSLDLRQANSYLLEKTGVRKRNIAILNYCTACLPNLFFSYRREKGTRGRHLNFISLG